VQAFELLGQIYIRERRLDAARDQFDAIARRDPRSVSARTMVAMLLEAQQHRDEAIRACEAVLGLQPTTGVARTTARGCMASREDSGLPVAVPSAR
jgi:cytochrome c-type biogenesis protein CcmH/NrfG